MVGSNAVELDLAADYPKLHPVFNVSLLTPYRSPDLVPDRLINLGIKKSYTDDEIVDWKLIKAVLDVRTVKKGKLDYLISWQNSTVGEDTWILQSHVPVSAEKYLEDFRNKVAIQKKKKKSKGTIRRKHWVKSNRPGLFVTNML